MTSNSNHKPSRWTNAVDTAQTRAYSLRRKAATVATGALAVFMGYHVIFGHNGITAYEQKRENTQSLLIQTQQLERENNRIREHVERLQNDPSSIEHQAREQLHYTRDGEVIYTLPPDPVPPSAPSASKHQ